MVAVLGWPVFLSTTLELMVMELDVLPHELDDLLGGHLLPKVVVEVEAGS